MANPRAFISFDYDNNSTERHLFVGMTKNSRTPIFIEDWSSKTELPQHTWERIINEKISKCNMLIVLVGKKTRLATGVVREIKFAKEHNIPAFGVYVDNADAMTVLPEGMMRSRLCNWKWNDIANWVDQCMKEGKNK
jgi:hypothetical protein